MIWAMEKELINCGFGYYDTILVLENTNIYLTDDSSATVMRINSVSGQSVDNILMWWPDKSMNFRLKVKRDIMCPTMQTEANWWLLKSEMIRIIFQPSGICGLSRARRQVPGLPTRDPGQATARAI